MMPVFAGFVVGNGVCETSLVAGVWPETQLSALVGRGLLANNSFLFGIKREKFFGKFSYFLGRQRLGISFTHDQAGESTFGETDALMDMCSQGWYWITIECFSYIPTYSCVYDFTINRKDRFQ
jgi:hypothetical protein